MIIFDFIYHVKHSSLKYRGSGVCLKQISGMDNAFTSRHNNPTKYSNLLKKNIMFCSIEVFVALKDLQVPVVFAGAD